MFFPRYATVPFIPPLYPLSTRLKSQFYTNFSPQNYAKLFTVWSESPFHNNNWTYPLYKSFLYTEYDAETPPFLWNGDFANW